MYRKILSKGLLFFGEFLKQLFLHLVGSGFSPGPVVSTLVRLLSPAADTGEDLPLELDHLANRYLVLRHAASKPSQRSVGLSIVKAYACWVQLRGFKDTHSSQEFGELIRYFAEQGRSFFDASPGFLELRQGRTDWEKLGDEYLDFLDVLFRREKFPRIGGRKKYSGEGNHPARRASLSQAKHRGAAVSNSATSLQEATTLSEGAESMAEGLAEFVAY